MANAVSSDNSFYGVNTLIDRFYKNKIPPFKDVISPESILYYFGNFCILTAWVKIKGGFIVQDIPHATRSFNAL